jgi:hypothetical protein
MKLLFAFLLLFTPSLVRAAEPELVPIKSGQPVTIRPDRAYILFRTVRPQGVHSFEPVFLRILRPEELAAFEAAKRDTSKKAPAWTIFNVNRVDAAKAFVKGRPEIVYLVEAVPGDYVLYGVGWEFGGAALATCMCLGSVGFSAPAGTVTDMGYFFADVVHDESKIPEIRPESGFGQTMQNPHLIGATVRPVHSGTTVPEALRGATVAPAVYRAVGKFVERRVGGVNRLVPVPGILDYDDRGRVVDVPSGQVVPDVN